MTLDKKEKRTPVLPEEDPAQREKYLRRLKRAGLCYGLMALVIIPIYTILYATRADLITRNMSYIGGYMGGYRGLVLWGVVSGLFYLGFTSYLFMLTKFTNKRVRRMLFAACAMLIITVLLPFVPEIWPRAAEMHNFFAMLAPIVMVLTMYLFVFYLAKCDRGVYKRALWALNSMVLVSAVLMFLTGSSGLLEVVFSVGMCVLLFMILIWLSHSEHVDLVRAMRQAEEKRQAEAAAREAEERAQKVAEAARRRAEQAQRAQQEAKLALARAKEATREARELEAEKRELEEAARQAEAQMLAVEEAHRMEEMQAAQRMEQREAAQPADKPRRQEG